MKRKIIILAALAVFMSSTAAYAASANNGAARQLALEKVAYAAATVTANHLNVREGPATTFPSICKLDKGQAVTVIGKVGDWYAIFNAKSGIVGAVDGRYIRLQKSDSEAATASKSSDTAVNNGKTDTKTNDKASDKTKGKLNDKATDKSSKTDSKTEDKSKSKAVPKVNQTPKVNPTPSKGTSPAAIAASLSQDEQKLLELVNKARANAGLESLTVDEKLMKAARTKAKDMIDNGYFSHQSPTYGSPFDMMRQFDNAFKSAGENIAGNKTVDGAFKAWMSSDSHKKNILNSGFKVTGIGVENSATYGKILVQQFIGR